VPPRDHNHHSSASGGGINTSAGDDDGVASGGAAKHLITCGIGTLTYMAPELFTHARHGFLRGLGDAGPMPADVYAFGLLLWALHARAEPWHDGPHKKFELIAAVVCGVRPLMPPSLRAGAGAGADADADAAHAHAAPLVHAAHAGADTVDAADAAAAAEEAEEEGSRSGAAAGGGTAPPVPAPGSAARERGTDGGGVLGGGGRIRRSPIGREIRALIEACWAGDPEQRPTFVQVCSVLDELRDLLDRRAAPPPSYGRS